MAASKPEILLPGPMMPFIEEQLDTLFQVHRLAKAADKDALIAELAPRVRGIAYSSHMPLNGAFMQRLPKLEIVSSFGVGYDSIDAKWAGEHGIVVTNTPDVLTEEVADTALGLLLMTVRELPQSERYLRAGKWLETGLSAHRARCATARSASSAWAASARRSPAASRPSACPSSITRAIRRRASRTSTIPTSIDMARDVDMLIVIMPGGPATKNLINAEVLKALGSNGILINVARGSVVDEPALIEALRSRTIYSAGLDVFADEPQCRRN